MNADQEAAPATVDIDQRLAVDGFFDIDRHGLFGAEGAGPADEKAGVAIGDFRFAGLDFLAADLTCQLLGRNLAVAVHQHDQWLGIFILENQRLDHGVTG